MSYLLYVCLCSRQGRQTAGQRWVSETGSQISMQRTVSIQRGAQVDMSNTAWNLAYFGILETACGLGFRLEEQQGLSLSRVIFARRSPGAE
jgi:hypothetical protein